MKHGRARILVLSSFDGRNASAIGDFLASFHVYSRHEIRHVFDVRLLDHRFDFSAYDAILLFWSLYLLGPSPTPEVRARIRSSRATKVLFLQDEYRDVRQMNSAMAELGIEIMFTCVDEKDHDLFYPRNIIPSLRSIHTVFPGYVPVRLARRNLRTAVDRPIDVGYRGRELPYWLGDLAREKWELVRRFREICARYSLTCDISGRECDRLYGNQWTRFLSSCRCTLGSASGASVIDFDGSIRARCEEWLELHPAASYEEVRQRCFADVDGKTIIDTVSPRIFEAVALGSTLVLQDGRYSGALVPHRHFIPVRKDYSNVEEVVAGIRDRGLCERLARNAWEDLIASGRHGYEAFVRRFDQILDAHGGGEFGSTAAEGQASGHRPVGMRFAFHLRNFLEGGAPILPWRDRFVTLPAWSSALQRAWQFLHDASDPARPVRDLLKGSVALATIWGCPQLRRILESYVRNPGLRHGLGLDRLLEELLKIALLREAVRGDRSRHPFRVRVLLDPPSNGIRFVSTVLDAGREGAGARADEVECRQQRSVLEEWMTHGRVRKIVWDHSAIARPVRCPVMGLFNLPINVGPGAQCNFETLVSLLQRGPRWVGPPLAAALDW